MAQRGVSKKIRIVAQELRPKQSITQSHQGVPESRGVNRKNYPTEYVVNSKPQPVGNQNIHQFQQYQQPKKQFKTDVEPSTLNQKNIQIEEKTLQVSSDLYKKLRSAVHQETQPTNQSKVLVRTNLKCYVCFDGLENGELVVMEKCKHGLHKHCLLPSLQYQLSKGKTDLGCPFEDCSTSNLSEQFLRRVLSQKDRQRLNRFQAIMFVESKRKDGLWQPCPQPNCKQLFLKNKSFGGKYGDLWYICNTSNEKYCLKCNRKYHSHVPDCKEYQMSLDPSTEEYKMVNYIQQAGFKQCPNCKKFVEKNEGCNHITCICKYQFCYACNGPYPNCDCPTVREHRERMAGNQR